MTDLVCEPDFQLDPYSADGSASCPVASLRCAFLLALASAREHAGR
ncbi:hypothetical protein P3T43_005963 [Paraburkholderia sp. GAS41]|jgi:hypothetical protein